MPPDPMPPQVSRDDYVYCEPCKLLWPKISVTTRQDFYSGKKESICPKEHVIPEPKPSA